MSARYIFLLNGKKYAVGAAIYERFKVGLTCFVRVAGALYKVASFSLFGETWEKPIPVLVPVDEYAVTSNPIFEVTELKQ